jgi:hypothetical protein
MKKYLKEKRRIMETQIFHHAKTKQKTLIFIKSSKKETKILQDIIITLL